MKKCLKRLLSQLKRFPPPNTFSLPLKNNLPEVLAADEHVARFIFHPREITATYKPFMPEKGTGLYETSVCRKTNVSEERIWELAKTLRLPKVAIARVDLGVAVIHESNLKANAAPVPAKNYHEHSVIVGWPLGDEEKAKHKEIAINLAAEAKVIKVPS